MNFVNRAVVTSFSANVLKKAKELEPRLPTVLDPTPQDGTLTPKQVMDQVVPCANVVAYYYPHIDKELMDEARMAESTSGHGTADKPEDILRVINLGVQGVMTNRPDVLSRSWLG